MALSLVPEVLAHVIDVHCHPTDAENIDQQDVTNLQITICAMSASTRDQDLVKSLAQSSPTHVIPAFGYHPWFSHHISLTDPPLPKEQHYRALLKPGEAHEDSFQAALEHLPEPTPLTSILNTLKQNLTTFPNAMIGEVGLDRAFRVPINYYTSPRHLTRFTIPIEHQLAMLEAQLELAVEMKRNISIHSVKAQQATIQLLNSQREKHGAEKWNTISVDMHSCGLSVESWKDLERKHENMFLSFSTIINQSHPQYRSVIAAANQDRLLAESDYNDIRQCTQQTCDIIAIIAEAKGWLVESEWKEDVEPDQWGAVRRLEANWKRFQAGKHATRTKRRRKPVEYRSVSEGEEASH